MPALVTMTSRRPNASTARATSSSAVSLGPTAPTSATASPPASVIASTARGGIGLVDVVDDDGGPGGGEGVA